MPNLRSRYSPPPQHLPPQRSDYLIDEATYHSLVDDTINSEIIYQHFVTDKDPFNEEKTKVAIIRTKEGYIIRNMDEVRDITHWTRNGETNLYNERDAYNYQIATTRDRVESHIKQWRADPDNYKASKSIIARTLGIKDNYFPKFPKYLPYLKTMDTQLRTWEREGLISVEDAGDLLDKTRYGLEATDPQTAIRDLTVLLVERLLL
jgi:hypothetical protein